jgi:hypothetical protein
VGGLRDGAFTLGLEPDAVQSVLRGFEQSGFGYGEYRRMDRPDYPSSGSYGLSVVHPDNANSIIQAAGLQVTHYIPAGWDNHQDVYACQATASIS